MGEPTLSLSDNPRSQGTVIARVTHRITYRMMPPRRTGSASRVKQT